MKAEGKIIHLVSTTLQPVHDITPENDKRHDLTRQMILHYVAMFTCEKSSNRIKQAP